MLTFEKTLLPHLGKTAKYAGFYFIDTFQENGIDLSKEQWLVLKKLHMQDGPIQNDLAFITNRSKTSLTRLINTMEKKELVFRVASKKDKRINHIYLSNLGKGTFLKAIPIINKIMKDLQKGIPTNDLLAAMDVLSKIQKNIDKKNFIKL